MLKYRDQIEQGLKLQENNEFARVRRGLKTQLKKLNAQIDSFIKENEKDLLHGFGFTVQGKSGGNV